MRMHLRNSGRRRRHNCQKRGRYRWENRERCGSSALSVGACRICLGVMMSRVIVAVMMTDVRRVRIAHDNFQSSIDWSEHEARGNESTEAQQSEYEGGNPTGYATVSRSIRLRDFHIVKMPDRLRGIK
jgi:hypothetical protein